MSPRSLVRRRPSAALVVSFIALFVALGGAGWAALRVPANSVGTAQLQNFSVSNAKLRGNSVGAGKIISGAVGARQVNSSQVQLRITSSCLIGAVQSFTAAGDVTCTPALPTEYGTSSPSSTLGVAPPQVATLPLSAGPSGPSYLVIGNVKVAVGETAPQSATQPQSVAVHCSMSLVGSSGTSGEFDANLGGSGPTTQSGTIPLVLPVVVSGSQQTAAVNCSESASPPGPAPSVVVTPTINAIQTAANN
jgi:hypothetical protein